MACLAAMIKASAGPPVLRGLLDEFHHDNACGPGMPPKPSILFALFTRELVTTEAVTVIEDKN